MKKILIQLFAICIFTACVLCFSKITVRAESNVSLTQLKAKFPHGKYWNHSGSSVNNPDGYTNTPCTHHGNCSKNDTDYSGWCGCNSFGSAIQCMGFANKLAYDAYGSLPSSWSRTNLDNLKAGDVIRYKNNTNKHSIFVTAVNGNTVTYGDCNSDGHCGIRWDKTISKGTVAASLIEVYSAPSVLSVNSGNNPEGGCDIVSTKAGSIYIKGWVIDKDSKSTSLEVHVYIGGPAGEGEGHPGIIANKYRPDIPANLDDAELGNYHGLEETIYTQKSGNQDVYVYAINVGSGENILLGKANVYIAPDTTSPEITEAKISDINNEGYTITCNVTDDVNVDRVIFSTWTEKNGQDDKVEEQGIKVGNTYTYHVKISNHNYEFGNYITHIYAYDYSGNYEIYPQNVNMGNKPEGGCNISSVKEGSIYIKGWAIDKDMKSEPIELHVYIGGSEGEGHPGIIADKYRPDVPENLKDEELGDYHGIEETIYTKKTGTQDVYVYAINVGKGDNTLLAKETVYIEPDTTKPDISNIKISDVTSDGYTITCDVEDNVTVKRVVFSTWTDSNGQDDKLEEEGTKSGNTYTYRVKRSSHNNECGDYTTHIFAYDYTGNYALSTAGTTDIGHIEVIDKGTEATCETEGRTEGKHCSACGETLKKQEVIPAKGHTEAIDEGVAATCETDGKTEGSHCSVCGKELKKQEVIPAKGHTVVTDKAIAATCETEGKTEGSHCSVCKKVLKEQEVIPAKGHTEVADKGVTATCETEGKTEGSHCSVCGKVLEEQKVIPAKGHTVVTDKAVAATCETEGKTEGKHCSVCGEVLKKQEVIPAKGHTEVIDEAVAATCETEGKTEGSHCSVCGKELKKQEIIPAKGHSFDNGVIERPATQYEEGLKIYTCSNCGLTRTEVIAKLPVTEQEKPSNPGSGNAEKTEPEQPKAEQPQTEQPKREATKNTENKVPVGSVLVEEKTGGVYKVLRVSGGTGEVQYMKPTGTSSTAVVPDTVTINGVLYRVTEISDNAFKGNINLRKVVIGRYVKRIGKNAFANCKRLQSVTMGSAVTVIDDKAFFKCTSLKKITIPGQIVKIGKKAFFGAKKLKTITIKTKKLTMKTVGSKAFKGIYAKAKIKVSKAKKKLYRNVLRKRGISGRAVIK
ncbi:MAG: leucine-rich repeat protein [Clostridiales bacterium]|nr:leucine-rich repeat protein [Clostridiales bacterium]